MRPVPFPEYRWIFPPRPGGATNPAGLHEFEGKGRVAQWKYNDIRVLIYLLPEGELRVLNRHAARLGPGQYSARGARSLASLRLPHGGIHVFDGGALRTNGSPFILWDVLVFNGRYLLGTTYESRYRLLNRALGEPRWMERKTGHGIALEAGPYLWLAPLFKRDFRERYEQLLHLPEVEGLVIKDPKGRLDWGLREENNGRWAVKVRKPHALYAF